jgi:hypothetical protein
VREPLDRYLEVFEFLLDRHRPDRERRDANP